MSVVSSCSVVSSFRVGPVRKGPSRIRPAHQAFVVFIASFVQACASGNVVPSMGDAGGSDSAIYIADSSAYDAGVVDAAADAGRDAGPAVVPECELASLCQVAPPTVPGEVSFDHTTSSITAALGGARHRGRDLIVREGQPVFAMAKFAYGTPDTDLVHEKVGVYLSVGCGSSWQFLGDATTTDDGEHPTIYNVRDTGGRVYLRFPENIRLPIGRHLVHFVVRGDLSTADQFIDVVPQNARYVVSDVDGTLTTSESAEFLSTVGVGNSPGPNPGSAEVLNTLAKRGYRILYLTARPEWMDEDTRQWLNTHGFPPGAVHTTQNVTPAFGAGAVEFKSGEIQALIDNVGREPDYVFGNTATDAEAYANTIDVGSVYYFQFDGAGYRGTRIEDYRSLVPGLSSLVPMCR